ncbi:MAG TPA: hypothetical protein VES20_14625 [Bryobacteraceae bacterium]|nr:hypothetical protein [Bryobacteraceae bacterium]
MSAATAVDEMLQLCGSFLLPLAFPFQSAAEFQSRLRASGDARQLFPGAPAPEAALAGLWLLAGDFDRSHSIAQEIHTPDGSYWHAILHRMEPDAANAGYWYRRVGQHPIFPALARHAGLSQWDPFAFIQRCERARLAPGSAEENELRRIATFEWQLLFAHCAGREPGPLLQPSEVSGVSD